ncbi:YceI family protein [Candidatus Uhrbacteria bacterium]|nr:YceI family protein [Candidatus Uhrbacteria bacterium]
MTKKYLGFAALAIAAVGLLLMQGSAAPSTAVNNAEASQKEIGAEPLQDGSYEIVSGSSINWEGRKTMIAGYKDVGTVPILQGKIAVSGGKITGGNMIFDMSALKVGATGKQKGESMLERHLKSDSFFNAEKFPTAEFVIKEAAPEKDAADSFRHAVSGELTMKGITREVAFSALAFMKEGKAVVAATFDLDRTLWDIRFGSAKFFDDLADNVIDDKFTVSFSVVANPAR